MPDLEKKMIMVNFRIMDLLIIGKKIKVKDEEESIEKNHWKIIETMKDLFSEQLIKKKYG